MNEVRTLIVEQDDELGEHGFVLDTGHDIAEGSSYVQYIPLLVAHDVLEHLGAPEDLSAPWDEVMALGAIWYLRGTTGKLRDGLRSIFYDLATCIRDDWHGMIESCAPSSVPATVDDDTRADLRTAAVAGIRTHAQEYLDSDDCERYGLSTARAMYRLLCHGYARAAERYPDQYETLRVWDAIEAAALGALHEYANESYVGLRLRFAFGLRDDGEAFASIEPAYLSCPYCDRECDEGEYTCSECEEDDDEI